MRALIPPVGQRPAPRQYLLNNKSEKTGGADVTCRLQFGHGLHLLLGLPCASKEHCAAQRMHAAFHHGTESPQRTCSPVMT